MSKQARKVIGQENTTVLLTYDEKKNPEQVIRQFCKTFRRSYAQIELLDMLDATIKERSSQKKPGAVL